MIKTEKVYKLRKPKSFLVKGVCFVYENKNGETVTIEINASTKITDIDLSIGLSNEDIEKIERVMPLSEVVE